jgi:hypothetical protein
MKEHSMNLTKAHRSQFVADVMSDIPKVDYRQQIEVLIKQDIDNAPDKFIRDALKVPILRSMLIAGNNTVNANTSTSKYGHPELSTFKYGYGSDVNDPETLNCSALCVACYLNYQMSKSCADACYALMKQNQEQEEKLASIRVKVFAAIAGCTTRKTALAAMPEFEKYLPEVVTPSKFPIAIANLSAELMMAGWPKGGKKEVVAA